MKRSEKMKRILVLGFGGPAGYNFIEALRLAKEKFFFVGTDANKYHLELTKAEKSYQVPPCSDPKYIEIINNIIDENGIEFIHAQPDIEVKNLSDAREQFHATVFLPSKKCVDICQDKFLSAQAWHNAGIPSPETFPVKDESLDSDLSKIIQKLGFPFWLRATSGAGGRGSTLVKNKETAVHWIKYWRARDVDWEFIAQQYLPGRNFAFHSLMKDGKMIVSQARERLEYIYPYLAPSGITGTPVVARTVHNEKVNEIATKAITAIDPQASGIFCVDLKESKDGVPYPTEINPGRFFTSSLFLAFAGQKLNIPHANIQYNYIKLGFNEPLPKDIPKYNVLPEDLYWIRHIDCGYHLVDGKKWKE
jgi:biotin carboxylase